MKKTSCLIVFVLAGAMILSSCNKNNNNNEPATPSEYKLTFHQTEQGENEDFVFTVIPGKTIQSDVWDVEPDVNPKTGYTGEWDEYDVEAMTGDFTVEPIYTPIEYKATFINRANDQELGTAKFTVETESLNLPDLPIEVGYTYAWESYTISANNMNVYCDRTTNQHTVKFYADEEKTQLVGQETFTIETESVTEPAVPAKDGFDGFWPDYNLHVDQDVDVVAEYIVHQFYVQFRVNGENYGSPVGYQLGDTWSLIEKPAVQITGYTVSWPEDVTLTNAERDNPQVVDGIVTANSYTVHYEGTEETTSVTYNASYTLLSAGGIYSWVLNDEDVAESGEHWLIAGDVTLSKKVTINTRVYDFEDGENKIVTIFDNFNSLEVVDGEGTDGSKALKASYTGDSYKDCHLNFNKDYLDIVFADPSVKALSFYAKGTFVTNNFRHIEVDKQYVNNETRIISCYEINSNGYGIENGYKQFYLTRGVYSQMTASSWSIQYGVSGAADLYLDNFQVSTHDYYEFKQNSLERGYFEKNNDTTYYLRDSTTSQANFLVTTGSADNKVSIDYEKVTDGHRSFKIEKKNNGSINLMLRGNYQYSNLPEEGILFDFYTTSSFNGWWNGQETGGIADGNNKHFVENVNDSFSPNRWYTIHLTKDHIKSDGGNFLLLQGSVVADVYIDNIRVVGDMSESFEAIKALRVAANGDENPQYYGYAVGFNLANHLEAGTCRDVTKNYHFMIGWNACTAIEISSEFVSHGSQSLKVVKTGGGTFHIEPQWLSLMDDDSTISFDIYTEDSNRLTCPISGASDRTITIESGVWNTITLTKDDFEDDSSRFTTNAFGAGTYYIDNMQLHL